MSTSLIDRALENFSLGMMLKNHNKEFMAGRIMCMTHAATVFEAEAIGTREALSRIKTK